MNEATGFGPLDGLKVLDIATIIAGPMVATLMADFGADVTKLELPGVGDGLRAFPPFHQGKPLWWKATNRGKRFGTLDLRNAAGKALFIEHVKRNDVLIENFRPGTLESWGLGWDALHAINPQLVMLRISGYGQTGPYRDRPGFGLIGEAMGGLRHLSGEPKRPPVRVGVSIGDSLAALHGVIGVLLALRHRDQQGGVGQVIDVALYEAVFNMMESLLPEYSVFQEIRQPAGSSLPGITPSNAYPCADGKYALIAGNGDSIFKRLMAVIGRQDLADAPEYARNDGRARAADLIDGAIEAWTRRHSLEDVLQSLHNARIPAGRVYDIADICDDPHYQARNMLLNSQLDDGTPVKLPGIVPKLSTTPGTVRRSAPKLGQDTTDILTELGIDARTLEDWRQRGIV